MSKAPLCLRLLSALLVFSTACTSLQPPPTPSSPPALSARATPTLPSRPTPARAATQPATGLAALAVDAAPTETSAPSVIGHTRVSEPAATRRPVFVIRFSRPMDTASVAAALSLQPAAAFELTWNDRHDEGRLTVSEALVPHTTYTFTLASTAADLSGRPLERPTVWMYRPRPVIARTQFPTASNTRAPVILDFNYPMQLGVLEAAFRLAPALAGELRLTEGGTRLTFTPASPLPYSTRFTLSFTGALFDANGDPIPELGPFTFVTPSAVVWTYPVPGGRPAPTAPVQIRFDRAMDHAATTAALTIEPATPGQITWDDTTLIFTPTSGYLSAGTVYTVSVGTSALTADGERLLTRPYRLSFQTGAFEQMVSFGDGPNAQVLDADGRRAVQFVFKSVGEYTRIQFDLYRLTPEQFLAQYSAGFRGVLGYEGREFFDTTGLPLAQTWGVDPAAQPVAADYEGWLAETVLPAEVPPGAYVLEARTGSVNDQLLVVLTHHTVVVKQVEGRLLTWVTDFQGAPTAEAEVGVYARDGEQLAAGRTDAAGLFRSAVTRDPQPLIVLAQVGGGLTAAGLGPEWRTESGYWEAWWRPTPQASDYAVYLYTDRPIYRPGQTVYFKAVVRRDDDAVYSLLPAGTTLTARLRDARENVVRTFYLFTNEFGTVSSLFRIAEGAMLGDYAVELALDGETFRQTFKVHDYSKPPYTVAVSTEQGRYVAGDPIQVSVDSRYFFGEPVAGATVRLKSYELGPEACWEACSGEDRWYGLYDQPERMAVTDADGRATFTLAAPLGNFDRGAAWWTNVSHSRIALEATVDDGSRLTVSGFAAVDVFSAGARLSLDTGGYLKAPGAPITVQAEARSITDTPLAGQALTLHLRGWNAETWEHTTVLRTWEARTGPDGRVVMTIDVAQAGFYQLRVTGRDSRGQAVTADTWLYIFDEAASGARADHDLSLVADRAAYAPGETANLLIESAFGGQALLTFERGTVRREQLVTLTPPITRVPVVIQPDDVPNLVVNVSAWQPLTRTLTSGVAFSFADRQLRTASVNLSVPAVGQQLVVTLTPDKTEYAPREAATFKVRVTGADGGPVAAEVSLALVDEAIFSLSQELSGPIFEALYHERPSLVRTFDALALERWLILWGDGGRGGGDEGAPPANPRSQFPDTAIWEPALVTDANGEAVLTLNLPDTLTSWRLTAKAVTIDHRVGAATLNVITRQPIVVQPLLPRSLTAGDRFELSALLHNFTGAAQEVVVGVQADDRLAVTGALTQTLRLAAGEQRVVGWPAVVAGAGEVGLIVYAETLPAGQDGGRDAVQAPLTIQPLAVPEVTTQVGELAAADAFTTTLPLPADALDLSTVHIELSRSIAGSLLTGLAYLTGFPYGCVEQTMSRALPNAVVGRASQELGFTDPTLLADLPPKIDASVQRLYGFQHSDGGWGWWYDDATDAYQTAWVVFGLAVTAQGGYEVDADVIQAGAQWLTANLTKMDERTRAFALYSLAVAGYGDLAATRALALQAARLDSFSRAGLVLALHKLGAAAEAAALLSQLADSAVQQAGMAYWPDAAEDGHYRAKTMSSTTRSTALVLSALVALDPEHSLITPVVRYLMGQRQASGWGSTNETSFTILALTDYLVSRNAGDAETGYTVELNGQVLASGQLGPGQPAAVITIPAAQMRVGANTLRLAPSGDGRLYYVVTQRLYQPQIALAAAGAIQFERRYLDARTNRPITGAIVAGQLVRVQLTVTLPRAGAYMLVEDRLAGGLEALNESLNTTSHDATVEADCYGDDYSCQGLSWRQYGYNHKEVRADRVTFFITQMPGGPATFAYLARATRSGEFVALPAEAYAMYDAALWGRSASAGVVIAK